MWSRAGDRRARKGLFVKIMVSACLLGENCKYNGGNNYSEKVAGYIEGHQVIPVCPEVLGGLPTPRVPSEIVDGVVMSQDGRSVDKEFRRGAELALRKAMEEKTELVILQSRSPSCGARQIYDGTFSGTKTDGQGIFAELLRKNGFAVADVEELKESCRKHMGMEGAGRKRHSRAKAAE